MEIFSYVVIVLLIIILLFVLVVLLSKPGECYDCGSRFTKENYSFEVDNRYVCKPCWSTKVRTDLKEIKKKQPRAKLRMRVELYSSYDEATSYTIERKWCCSSDESVWRGWGDTPEEAFKMWESYNGKYPGNMSK